MQMYSNTRHSQQVTVTSFLRGDHQCLGGLAPALPCLGCDAEDIDGLRLEAGHCVLASTGAQHVHRGCVAVGGVEVVCDLVGWREVGDKQSYRRCHKELSAKLNLG